jgi:hypothetical protein
MKHLSGVWAHIYIQEEIEGKKRKKREREKKRTNYVKWQEIDTSDI